MHCSVLHINFKIAEQAKEEEEEEKTAWTWTAIYSVRRNLSQFISTCSRICLYLFTHTKHFHLFLVNFHSFFFLFHVYYNNKAPETSHSFSISIEKQKKKNSFAEEEVKHNIFRRWFFLFKNCSFSFIASMIFSFVTYSFFDSLHFIKFSSFFFYSCNDRCFSTSTSRHYRLNRHTRRHRQHRKDEEENNGRNWERKRKHPLKAIEGRRK